MNEYSVNLETLCPELTDIIFSGLPTSSLRSLRLVNRQLGSIATKWAFQRVRLAAREGQCDHDQFVRVAQSERVRPYVREIICDTWLGPNAEQGGAYTFNIPQGFLKALPLLRCFRSLTALHLRFSEHTKHVYTNGKDAEPDDFRYRVLDTVFHCLAGTWSAKRQLTLDRELFGKILTTYYTVAPSDMGAIPIRELTVSNLADFDDKRLTDSEVFKKVISMRSLTSLKLCITQQEVDENLDDEQQPDSAIWFRQKYDMFENLPQTWLSPSIAANLKVLSLYSKDYWGWNPRMDFRAILPGDGLDCGLPQLRILALGRFVFSHEWQFDWIASLGQMNGSGGLEEVYLDRCPIMVQARHQAPADYDVEAVGKASEGNAFSISNGGYHLIDEMVEGDAYDANIMVEDFSLRWHRVLPRWREQMKALRVFKMGHSSWNSAPKPTMDAWRLENPGRTPDKHLNHLLKHNNFRHFDLPSPPSLLDAQKASTPDLEKYTLGTGIDDGNKFQARYVYFDINSRPSEWCDMYWPSTAHPRQPYLKGEIRIRDTEEVSHILDFVNGRKRSLGA